jgi:hypothetical protein
MISAWLLSLRIEVAADLLTTMNEHIDRCEVCLSGESCEDMQAFKDGYDRQVDSINPYSNRQLEKVNV